jgi:hypothetical protein
MKKIILLLFSALISSSSFAADDKVFIKGARPMGMGGAFTAISDDENAFFYNPAGISQRDGFLLALPFSINLKMDSQTFEVLDFINKNSGDLKHFDDLFYGGQAGRLTDEINNKISGKAANAYMSFLNPAFISGRINLDGKNYLNFGLGIFDYAEFNISFLRGAQSPILSYNVQMTAAAEIPVSYTVSSLKAIGLPGALSLGANFKYILRHRSSDEVSLVDFTEDDYKTPQYLGRGFGADLGAVYRLDNGFNLGFQITDIFATPVKYEKRGGGAYLPDAVYEQIPAEINLGAAFSPSKIFGVNFDRKLAIAADLRNISGGKEKLFDLPLKKLHFGGEYRLAPFAFRAGYNAGYPSFGLGLELNYIRLSYAFYGEESGEFLRRGVNWTHEIKFSAVIGSKTSGNKKRRTAEKRAETKSKSAGGEYDAEAAPLKVSPQMKLDISHPAVITSVEVEKESETPPSFSREEQSSPPAEKSGKASAVKVKEKSAGKK